MRSWELVAALILLSPLILTIVSFFFVSLLEAIREASRRRPLEAEMLPEELEELFRRRRRR